MVIDAPRVSLAPADPQTGYQRVVVEYQTVTVDLPPWLSAADVAMNAAAMRREAAQAGVR